MTAKTETGLELLARLGPKPSLDNLEPDLFSKKGLQIQEVIEMYGESGSGRTQCLLHLLARAILPHSWKNHTIGGLEVGVIFIDNDYHFSLIRLVGIMESKINDICKDQMDQEAENEVEDLIQSCLERLHVVKCNKSSQFVVTLQSLEMVLSNSPNITLLMIDSISSFYWLDRHSGGDNTHLQELNLRMACECIEKLVSTYSLVVIATKTALFQKRWKDGQDGTTPQNESSVEHCEYLCKAWQKLVNKRFIFQKMSTTKTICNGELVVNNEFSVTLNTTNTTDLKFPRTFTITDLGLSFSDRSSQREKILYIYTDDGAKCSRFKMLSSYKMY